MSAESREKEQDYKFGAIVYPDSKSFNLELTVACLQAFTCEWYYILHDKDTYTEQDEQEGRGKQGELKKPHYHILWKKSTPSQLGIVAKQMQIPIQFVQRVDKWKSSVIYLVHGNNPEKYQYHKSEIQCAEPSQYDKYFKGKFDEGMSAYMLIDYIQTATNTSTTAMASWAASNGLWSEFRRGYSVWRSMLTERQANL